MTRASISRRNGSDAAWFGSACHTREHTGGRAGDCRSPDEWADGDAARVAALERVADLPDGENRTDREVRVARSERRIASAAMRLDDPGCGSRLLGTLVVDGVDLVGCRRPTNHSWNANVPAGVVTYVRRRSSVAGTIRAESLRGE